jgi:hypothetical protein
MADSITDLRACCHHPFSPCLEAADVLPPMNQAGLPVTSLPRDLDSKANQLEYPTLAGISETVSVPPAPTPVSVGRFETLLITRFLGGEYGSQFSTKVVSSNKGWMDDLGVAALSDFAIPPISELTHLLGFTIEMSSASQYAGISSSCTVVVVSPVKLLARESVDNFGSASSGRMTLTECSDKSAEDDMIGSARGGSELLYCGFPSSCWMYWLQFKGEVSFSKL